MLAAPLGTRCSIGEDTQDVAKMATLRRKVSMGKKEEENKGSSSKFSSSRSSRSIKNGIDGRKQNGKKKAIAVSTGDGGLRVWNLESLLSNDDTQRQKNNLSCSRILIKPFHEGMFGQHSLLHTGESNGPLSASVITTEMCEIENMNLLCTGDTKGNVTIFCQLSWVKVLSFQAIHSITSLSVIGNEENILILTNGGNLNQIIL